MFYQCVAHKFIADKFIGYTRKLHKIVEIDNELTDNIVSTSVEIFTKAIKACKERSFYDHVILW